MTATPPVTRTTTTANQKSGARLERRVGCEIGPAGPVLPPFGVCSRPRGRSTTRRRWRRACGPDRRNSESARRATLCSRPSAYCVVRRRVRHRGGGPAATQAWRDGLAEKHRDNDAIGALGRSSRREEALFFRLRLVTSRGPAPLPRPPGPAPSARTRFSASVLHR